MSAQAVSRPAVGTSVGGRGRGFGFGGLVRMVKEIVHGEQKREPGPRKRGVAGLWKFIPWWVIP